MTVEVTAASVDARMLARAAAVHRVSWEDRVRPARVPATIVSGWPMPSSQAGSAARAAVGPGDRDRVGEQHQDQGRLGQMAVFPGAPDALGLRDRFD
jgi:hypothetical protein